MVLVADVGNTCIKLGVFEGDQLINNFLWDDKNRVRNKKMLEKFQLKYIVLGKSGVIRPEFQDFLQNQALSIWQAHQLMTLPFENHYSTPQTLGIDRLANVAASQSLFRNLTTLTIDCGTCITYDLLENGEKYLGGIISPGWEMRLKAMQAFTAKLPLAENKKTSLIGNDTITCLQSGAYNGLIKEIEGLIDAFSMQYSNLTTILTGGDALTLQDSIKKPIFARPNLQLEGLYRLFKFNINNF